jgi:hypothetical protein
MTRMTPFFYDIRQRRYISAGPNKPRMHSYELRNCILRSWIIIIQDLWFQAPSQELRIATRVDMMTVTRETKYSYWTRTEYCCIMRKNWKDNITTNIRNILSKFWPWSFRNTNQNKTMLTAKYSLSKIILIQHAVKNYPNSVAWFRSISSRYQKLLHIILMQCYMVAFQTRIPI